MCQTKNENKQDVGLLLLSSSVGTVASRKSPYAMRCATTSENSLDFSERDTLTAVSSVWHGHLRTLEDSVLKPALARPR